MKCLKSRQNFEKFERVLNRGLARVTVGTLTFLLSGCLLQQDQGTQELPVGSQTSTPADFQIQPPVGSNGGANGSGTGAGSGEQTQTPPPPVNPEVGLDFTIDSGAARTKDPLLHLDFLADFIIVQMKVGFSQDCSDGSWEPLQSQKDIQANTRNSQVLVSVQYMDYEGTVRPCLTHMIQHDDQGPDIQFPLYPAASLEEGATARLMYLVQDASPVASVVCRLNGVEKPCPAGSQEVLISQQPEGHYVFQVEAADSLGNTSSHQISWDVVSLSKHLLQTISVNNYKKVDILVVIDNSGSMEYEQKSMAKRVSNFLSILRGLDYQIGVTTTDPRNINLGDGRLIPIAGAQGQYLIDSSMNEADAQLRLGQTLQRPETGSGSEQAIRATYRAIERALDHSSPGNSLLFREGAQFASLVISDEDESDTQAKNDPNNLIQLIHNSFGGQKTFTWHSIITRPNDTACKAADGYAYGYRYDQLSRLTGGVIGSVCEMDYASQVSGIADGIRNMLKTLTLQCQPLAQFPIAIKRDGVDYLAPFTIEGVNLKFSEELAPGSYSVDFRCLK